MQNGPDHLEQRPQSRRHLLTAQNRHQTSPSPAEAPNAKELTYIALAQAQAQSGDIIGAENYYQYAEHYFRAMSADREAT
jgi:hypothetical protein